MKTLSLFFCLLITIGARAANPAFNDFNLNQFGTNAGVVGNGVRIKSGSLQSNNTFWVSSGPIVFKDPSGATIFTMSTLGGAFFPTGGLEAGAFAITNGASAVIFQVDGLGNVSALGNTNFFSSVIREGKTFIISSNTTANLSTLVKGDMAFWSSNGVAYLITSAPDGTLATNALLGGGAFNGNANQFSTAAGLTSIKTDALTTNLHIYASSQANGAVQIHVPASSGTAPISVTDDSGPTAVFVVNTTGTATSKGYIQSSVSFVVSSNLAANLAVLGAGDVEFWSSNGVPYYITSAPNGTLATNAFASGSGTVQNLTVTTTGLSESGNGTATLVLSSPSAVVTNGFTPALLLGGTVTSTNSFLFRSNTLASIPTLIKGDAYLWSSNGTPYIIVSSPAGILTTNILLQTASPGGGPFTNLTVFRDFWVTNEITGDYFHTTNGSVVWGGTGGTNSSGNGNISFDDSGTADIGNGIIFGVKGTAVGSGTDYIMGDGRVRLSVGNVNMDSGGVTSMKMSSANAYVDGARGITTNWQYGSFSNLYTASITSTGNGPTTIYGSAGQTNYLLVGTGGVIESNVLGTLLNKGNIYPSNSITFPVGSGETNANWTTVGSFVGPADTNGKLTNSFNAGSLTNYNSTNVIINLNADLAPTSNQTNYTIDLLPGPSGNMITIWLKNTNVFFLTITGTNNTGWQRSVMLRGDTNTVVSTLKFGTGFAVWTNANFTGFVTNGWQKVLNFYNADAKGTNVIVSDAGLYHF